MKPRRWNWLSMWCVLALSLAHWVSPVHAQSGSGVDVVASVNEQRAYAGQPVRLQVLIGGSQDTQLPEFPQMEGVQINLINQSARSSSSITIHNGQQRETIFRGYVYVYEIVFNKPGPQEIGPIAVEVEGQTYHTNPIQMEIVEPEQIDEVKMRLAVSDDRPFVGEGVILSTGMYFRLNPENAQLNLPGVHEHFEVGDLETPDPRSRRLNDGLMFLGSRSRVEQGQAVIDGRSYMSFTTRKVLFPREAGTVTIGPGSLSCDVIVSEARDFFGRSTVRRVVVPSNELDIEVRPLPTAGRPANFNGAVGSFSIHAKAQPDTVSVGDPVRLTVRVEHGGPHVRPPELDLVRFSTLAEDFRIAPESTSGVERNGGVEYEFTLRPLHDDIDVIGPIELPYFDPEFEEYSVIETRPIDLTVRPSRVVTAEDSIGGSGGGGGVGAVLEDATGGIAANAPRSDALRDGGFDIAKAMTSPWVIAGLATPPATYIALLLLSIVTKHQEHNSRTARKRLALRNAQRKLDEADQGDRVASSVRAAMLGYFEARLDRPDGTMTAEEAAASVDGVSGGLAERLRVLLMRCDAAHFGRQRSSQELTQSLINEARELLDSIDEEMQS